MTDNKNLLLAVVISMVILFGFQAGFKYFFPKPPEPTPVTQSAGPGEPATPGAITDGQATPPGAVATPSVPAAPAQVSAPGGGIMPSTSGRAEVIAHGPRVPINTPSIHGSIALTGGRIDDVTLAQYRETLDPHSPEIVLFTPPGTKDAYFAETGWVPVGNAVAVPGPETVWTADVNELTPETPLTLTWDNGGGLIFRRVISIDDRYMFTIRQTVENQGSAPVTLAPYSLVSRFGEPPVSGYFILFEGPLGVFNGTLQQVSYKDLQEKGTITNQTTGGWIGVTDKYWMSAIIPDQQVPIEARFIHKRPNNVNQYQVDFVGKEVVINPGQTIESGSKLFAGAKVVTLIDYYAEKYGIKRFDLAIDWGWFYFLTRPMFYALNHIHGWVGNFGVAILLLTVAIKLLFFPLANKSYRSMAKMRKLQPEMTKLRERFGDDRMRLNQEMMTLYKREKVNPASGCLPIVIQIPVFFSLYKVLFVTIEMRHAPFFGWIRDLSAPDPTTLFNLFGLIPWTPPQFLMIGAWPLIMGITMFLQQRLNPQPPDPIQAKVFMALPVVFTFMLAHFPAGLVIYWSWNNLLSIIQQWVIMRRAGATT